VHILSEHHAKGGASRNLSPISALINNFLRFSVVRDALQVCQLFKGIDFENMVVQAAALFRRFCKGMRCLHFILYLLGDRYKKVDLPSIKVRLIANTIAESLKIRQ